MYYYECDMISHQLLSFFKSKLKYKSIYMSNYVCPKKFIKTLQQLCQIRLYKDVKVLLKNI
jgi:hypothetical protein